jgi:hypothetical protein
MIFEAIMQIGREGCHNNGATTLSITTTLSTMMLSIAKI